MTALGIAAGAVCCLALAPGALRWLRVAQREHYLSGSVSRFAWRWWSAAPLSLAMSVVAVAGLIASIFVPGAAMAVAVVIAVGPPGLSPKGRTSKLAWTRRLRTLATIAALLAAVVVVVGVLAGNFAAGAAGAAVGLPLILDLALAAAAPLEKSLAGRHVSRASTLVNKVQPLIVGITGSYGKTSTKNYVAHLVAPFRSVVASPASFNNRAGLARTVNEHLRPDTEVLVAEMGAYGKGEIAELCRFLPPQISVITAIGPMHLERFGSLERTLAAKAEIIEHARTVVLAVDGPHLAGLAERLEAAGRPVVRCSGREPSTSSGRVPDVAVVLRAEEGRATGGERASGGEPATGERPPAGEGELSYWPAGSSISGGTTALEAPAPEAPAAAAPAPAAPAPEDGGERRGILEVYLHGALTGRVEVSPQHRPAATSNVACAIAVGLALGLGIEQLLGRLDSLPTPANRLQVYTAKGGFTVLDDTFNSNPEGAKVALRLLDERGAGGRRVVVTPGMVELGPRQFEENRSFAAGAAETAAAIVVVGRTNRRGLLEGARSNPATQVVVVDRLDQAVGWVRANLGPGDAVLYENDLPDHFL